MPMNAKKPRAVRGPGGAERPELQSLGYLTRYAHRAFVKALARALEPHGILSAQWSVLRVLWMNDGLSQVELAERMQVEKASLTGVLEGMERKGLIRRVRNTKDRRKIIITLTKSANRLKGDVLPYADAMNMRATRGMSAGEVERLRRSLTKVIANLTV